MKKLMTLTLGAVALIAFVVAPATSFAGSCGGDKAKAADSKLIGAHEAKAECTAKDAEACAARLGMSVEDCKKLCATEGSQMVNLSIEGMTCTGCENSITACLEGIEGVLKVGKVSHQEGTAFAVIDGRQVKAEALAEAVTKKGYKTQVVPAVATTDAASTMVSDKSGCGMAAQKSCSKTCAKTCTGKAKEGAKTETPDKTEGTL